MKRMVWLVMLALFTTGRLWAVTEAVFTSVTGKVEIRGHKGHMLRLAEKDSTVVEGERLVAGPDAQAVLQTFDGSQLTLSPNTDVWLDKLQQPGLNDKVIQFKLMLGQLLAKVTKLASAKSSFEVNAGGVICGVRGTQFQVKYDPTTNTVYLGVLEGTVFTSTNGQTTDYGPGSSAVFHNGVPFGGSNNGLPGGNGANGNGTNGNGNGGNGPGGNGNGPNNTGAGGAGANGIPGGNGNNNGGNNPPGPGGDSSTASLVDINGQFLGFNHTLQGNTFTDPSVGGTTRANITVVVPGSENVP